MALSEHWNAQEFDQRLLALLVLVDELFAISWLATSEEHMGCLVNHKWIALAEGETPESVWGCRCQVLHLHEQAEAAD